MHLVSTSEGRQRSASVVPLRTAPEPRRAEVTWPMYRVAAELGVGKRNARYQRDYLAALIENEGFPQPLPVLVKGALTREISPARSRWIAAAVQAWLDGTLPPGITAAIESIEAHDAADRLDAAADNLFGGDAA